MTINLDIRPDEGGDPTQTASVDEVILVGHGLRKAYGGVVAVRDFDLELRRGEICGLIGPNGSGKTTLLDLLCGIQQADQGTIEFAGKDVTYLDVTGRARAGLSRLFQLGRPFNSLTVAESLQVVIGPTGVASKSTIEDLLDVVGLSDHHNRLAQQLSYGQQRLLDFARALASSPRALLLDEPTAGVHSSVIVKIAELISRLARQQQVSLLVVEHNVEFVELICDRVVAMAEGCFITTGTAPDVLSDQRVISAYYGG